MGLFVEQQTNHWSKRKGLYGFFLYQLLVYDYLNVNLCNGAEKKLFYFLMVTGKKGFLV